MPKPKAFLDDVRFSAGRLCGAAAVLSVVALVTWPVAIGASDLTSGAGPVAPPKVQGSIDRVVGDATEKLAKSLAPVKEIVEAVNEVVAHPQPDGGQPAGSAFQARTVAAKRRAPRAVQADERDRKRGDVDELVASGDEIGADPVRRPQASRPQGSVAEPLPFTGFDPARLLLAGVTMILSGFALLTSARQGSPHRANLA